MSELPPIRTASSRRGQQQQPEKVSTHSTSASTTSPSTRAPPPSSVLLPPHNTTNNTQQQQRHRHHHSSLLLSPSRSGRMDRLSRNVAAAAARTTTATATAATSGGFETHFRRAVSVELVGAQLRARIPPKRRLAAQPTQADYDSQTLYLKRLDVVARRAAYYFEKPEQRDLSSVRRDDDGREIMVVPLMDLHTDRLEQHMLLRDVLANLSAMQPPDRVEDDGLIIRSELFFELDLGHLSEEDDTWRHTLPHVVRENKWVVSVRSDVSPCSALNAICAQHYERVKTRDEVEERERLARLSSQQQQLFQSQRQVVEVQEEVVARKQIDSEWRLGVWNLRELHRAGVERVTRSEDQSAKRDALLAKQRSLIAAEASARSMMISDFVAGHFPHVLRHEESTMRFIAVRMEHHMRGSIRRSCTRGWQDARLQEQRRHHAEHDARVALENEESEFRELITDEEEIYIGFFFKSEKECRALAIRSTTAHTERRAIENVLKKLIRERQEREKHAQREFDRQEEARRQQEAMREREKVLARHCLEASHIERIFTAERDALKAQEQKDLALYQKMCAVLTVHRKIVSELKKNRITPTIVAQKEYSVVWMTRHNPTACTHGLSFKPFPNFEAVETRLKSLKESFASARAALEEEFPPGGPKELPAYARLDIEPHHVVRQMCCMDKCKIVFDGHDMIHGGEELVVDAFAESPSSRRVVHVSKTHLFVRLSSGAHRCWKIERPNRTVVTLSATRDLLDGSNNMANSVVVDGGGVSMLSSPRTDCGEDTTVELLSVPPPPPAMSNEQQQQQHHLSSSSMMVDEFTVEELTDVIHTVTYAYRWGADADGSNFPSSFFRAVNVRVQAVVGVIAPNSIGRYGDIRKPSQFIVPSEVTTDVRVRYAVVEPYLYFPLRNRISNYADTTDVEECVAFPNCVLRLPAVVERPYSTITYQTSYFSFAHYTVDIEVMSGAPYDVLCISTANPNVLDVKKEDTAVMNTDDAGNENGIVSMKSSYVIYVDGAPAAEVLSDHCYTTTDVKKILAAPAAMSSTRPTCHRLRFRVVLRVVRKDVLQSIIRAVRIKNLQKHIVTGPREMHLVVTDTHGLSSAEYGTVHFGAITRPFDVFGFDRSVTYNMQCSVNLAQNLHTHLTPDVNMLLFRDFNLTNARQHHILGLAGGYAAVHITGGGKGGDDIVLRLSPHTPVTVAGNDVYVHGDHVGTIIPHAAVDGTVVRPASNEQDTSNKSDTTPVSAASPQQQKGQPGRKLTGSNRRDKLSAHPHEPTHGTYNQRTVGIHIAFVGGATASSIPTVEQVCHVVRAIAFRNSHLGSSAADGIRAMRATVQLGVQVPRTTGPATAPSEIDVSDVRKMQLISNEHGEIRVAASLIYENPSTSVTQYSVGSGPVRLGMLDVTGVGTTEGFGPGSWLRVEPLAGVVQFDVVSLHETRDHEVRIKLMDTRQLPSATLSNSNDDDVAAAGDDDGLSIVEWGAYGSMRQQRERITSIVGMENKPSRGPSNLALLNIEDLAHVTSSEGIDDHEDTGEEAATPTASAQHDHQFIFDAGAMMAAPSFRRPSKIGLLRGHVREMIETKKSNASTFRLAVMAAHANYSNLVKQQRVLKSMPAVALTPTETTSVVYSGDGKQQLGLLTVISGCARPSVTLTFERSPLMAGSVTVPTATSSTQPPNFTRREVQAVLRSLVYLNTDLSLASGKKLFRVSFSNGHSVSEAVATVACSGDANSMVLLSHRQRYRAGHEVLQRGGGFPIAPFLQSWIAPQVVGDGTSADCGSENDNNKLETGSVHSASASSTVSAYTTASSNTTGNTLLANSINNNNNSITNNTSTVAAVNDIVRLTFELAGDRIPNLPTISKKRSNLDSAGVLEPAQEALYFMTPEQQVATRQYFIEWRRFQEDLYSRAPEAVPANVAQSFTYPVGAPLETEMLFLASSVAPSSAVEGTIVLMPWRANVARAVVSGKCDTIKVTMEARPHKVDVAALAQLADSVAQQSRGRLGSKIDILTPTTRGRSGSAVTPVALTSVRSISEAMANAGTSDEITSPPSETTTTLANDQDTSCSAAALIEINEPDVFDDAWDEGLPPLPSRKEIASYIMNCVAYHTEISAAGTNPLNVPTSAAQQTAIAAVSTAALSGVTRTATITTTSSAQTQSQQRKVRVHIEVARPIFTLPGQIHEAMYLEPMMSVATTIPVPASYHRLLPPNLLLVNLPPSTSVLTRGVLEVTLDSDDPEDTIVLATRSVVPSPGRVITPPPPPPPAPATITTTNSRSPPTPLMSSKSSSTLGNDNSGNNINNTTSLTFDGRDVRIDSDFVCTVRASSPKSWSFVFTWASHATATNLHTLLTSICFTREGTECGGSMSEGATTTTKQQQEKEKEYPSPPSVVLVPPSVVVQSDCKTVEFGFDDEGEPVAPIVLISKVHVPVVV
eukprot:PhM_4_TR13674/c0_g1_i1/m.19456